MTNTNKTTTQLLATLTPAQALQVSTWAKDWLPVLQALSPAAYQTALRGVIAVVKSGKKLARRQVS
jgi:hypothetical protein